jgi:hypothetical protein
VIRTSYVELGGGGAEGFPGVTFWYGMLMPQLGITVITERTVSMTKQKMYSINSPKYRIKILLGNFNAKMGIDDIFKQFESKYVTSIERSINPILLKEQQKLTTYYSHPKTFSKHVIMFHTSKR